MSLQKRDILLYNDERYVLNRDIFKSYFKDNAGKKPKSSGFNSNLLRGYFSEFKINNNQLIATDIRIYVDIDQQNGELISKSVIDEVLPDNRFCNWFTGVLILFLLQHDSIQPSNYLKINITEGKLQDVRSLTEQEFAAIGNIVNDYYD